MDQDHETTWFFRGTVEFLLQILKALITFLFCYKNSLSRCTQRYTVK